MEEFVAAVFDDEYVRRVPPKSSLPPPRLLLLLLLLLALDDDKGEVVFEGLVEEVAGMTPHALREEKDVAQSVVIFNEKKEAYHPFTQNRFRVSSDEGILIPKSKAIYFCPFALNQSTSHVPRAHINTYFLACKERRKQRKKRGGEQTRHRTRRYVQISRAHDTRRTRESPEVEHFQKVKSKNEFRRYSRRA